MNEIYEWKIYRHSPCLRWKFVRRTHTHTHRHKNHKSYPPFRLLQPIHDILIRCCFFFAGLVCCFFFIAVVVVVKSISKTAYLKSEFIFSLFLIELTRIQIEALTTPLTEWITSTHASGATTYAPKYQTTNNSMSLFFSFLLTPFTRCLVRRFACSFGHNWNGEHIVSSQFNQVDLNPCNQLICQFDGITPFI